MLKGVNVPHRKNTKGLEPVKMPAPELLYFPAVQHIGAPAKPVVKVGDEVKVGTMLMEAGGFVSSPVYSSVSGKVKKIDDMLQSNGSYAPCVTIENDGQMTVDENIAPPDVHDFESFVEAVRASGIVGIGGAGFPTSVKLNVKDTGKIEAIVINGAECEPYITSDSYTMENKSEDISYGIELLSRYLGVKRFIIGIEKNKPAAIKSMRDMAKNHNGSVEVSVLPSVYPQGGEKVLVYHTLGKVIGDGQLPLDVGVIVLNCTTVAKIAEYVKTGMPLVEKCVTVDGSAVKEPKNVFVPVGTPAKDVFEFCGGFKSEPAKIIYGGPMMGISVSDDSIPVLKQTNALLAFDEKDAKPKKTTACIRCGRCTNTCPFGLAPVAIEKALSQNDMEALQALHANLCMECGCCSFICPAARPLVQQNKMAKSALMEYLKGGKK